MATQHVFDVGDNDFETAVIERSRTVPVVVDFWAPWCGPCRTLGPLLERLATQADGAFVLAKVNVDNNPGLSQAFRVQSIPMVLALKDGGVVDEFTGALPEAAVREFINRLVPSQAETLAVQAEAAFGRGSLDEAEKLVQQALQLDARASRALLVSAHLHAERGEFDTALQLLDRISGPLRAVADQLAAQLRIRQSGGGDEAALRARLDKDAADTEARFALAQVLAAQHRFEEALAEYLEIVRRDRAFGDDAARKAMLDIFASLGSGNELVERFRSNLARLLFS